MWHKRPQTAKPVFVLFKESDKIILIFEVISQGPLPYIQFSGITSFVVKWLVSPVERIPSRNN